MAIRIYGNRAIKTLPGQATRPTSARVREALFNIWRGRVSGCRWLDLCAGSGAMGAEALCRGAAVAVGIDAAGAACRVIRQNWTLVAQPEQSFQVLRGDVIQQLRKLQGSFDLIYFDPPYASGLYQSVLAGIAENGLLVEEGAIAVEYSPESWQPAETAGLALDQTKRYGSTSLAFFSPEGI
ncbi:16S rRNA (guanine(966)-N(2))-methyltransferase RsmD [Romeria aff. gracilis LEGE 07310]|uniref:16S rRNA (Guanine(966)-N(2))-methyltransferase RsmD n=1 Tax=Vasconcelosia minhoensis LEGE 07310 TaxID=915328 RepID=A0A8J7DBG0_9CYAN|nr:16S rRNA (guanine(966)-N(2))-methyltransferase RsmD [Romeria gracilis]MBE9077692.1 16S rRNA (guanine(966)-N(2))-methyltransferase RsmD [Romeria aff. gracilis LEGE 07310]